MNLLRKTRKSKIKISKKRCVLVILSLIMVVFAWSAYYSIINPTMNLHINSWNISIYVDENKNKVAEESEERNKNSAIEVNFLEMYPGMNQEVMDVIIKNNGETPSEINYTISDVSILGNTYKLQENGYVDAGGVRAYELISETEELPFKFMIEHTKVIEGGSEGYLAAKAVWISSLNSTDGLTEEQINEINENDSIWGYNVAEFLNSNPDESVFKFKIKINAIGLDRSSRYVLAQEITPENYGDYVSYSVDLDEDGNKNNDWKILYESNDNVFIIADDYISNSLVTGMTKGNSTRGVYFSSADVNNSIEQTIINKYMMTSVISNTNNNYKAAARLLTTSYWSNFVDSVLADYAVGAPTIEMFVKSWNQKYVDKNNYSSLNTAWEIINKGYNINGESEASISGYENANLYFPYTSVNNSCNGYWLASPSKNSTGSLMNVLYSGKISYSEINSDTGIGLRPVVCLKSGIRGTKLGDVWKLEVPNVK